MKKFLILFSLLSILVVSGCIGQTENKPLNTTELSFTQTIQYENQNMTVFVKRDSRSKEAFIEIDSFTNASQIQENKDLAKFAISFACNAFTYFFTADESAMEKGTREWDKMNRTLSGDFSTEEKVILEKNVFYGYEVKKVQFLVLDENTKQKLAECSTTGTSEDDVTIQVY